MDRCVNCSAIKFAINDWNFMVCRVLEISYLNIKRELIVRIRIDPLISANFQIEYSLPEKRTRQCETLRNTQKFRTKCVPLRMRRRTHWTIFFFIHPPSAMSATSGGKKWLIESAQFERFFLHTHFARTGHFLLEKKWRVFFWCHGLGGESDSTFKTRAHTDRPVSDRGPDDGAGRPEETVEGVKVSHVANLTT